MPNRERCDARGGEIRPRRGQAVNPRTRTRPPPDRGKRRVSGDALGGYRVDRFALPIAGLVSLSCFFQPLTDSYAQKRKKKCTDFNVCKRRILHLYGETFGSILVFEVAI
jgi:hypothetical protein